ncbi:MAG TPA: FGGY family carbohydrate kinase [Streptosporangiaceae bacterium]
MPAVILAVDQGSSSSRCVVLDAALTPVAVASRPLGSSFPSAGHVEHDPGEILAGVLAVMSEGLARAGAGWPDVAGIGLAAQTETFVVWDRSSGQPVCPAISWRDTRASGACDELRAAGHEAAIRSRTGLPLEPAFSASKLRWLLAEIPGARRAAASGRLLFGDVGCWLTWHLSGGAVHVTDPSMAARTMLLDLASRSWDPAMLELFDIPAQMLPGIAPTASRIAVTRAAVCGGRAPVSAIVGDQQAALFGQRCWREGMTKLTLGTGAFLWCNSGTSPPPLAPAGVVATCAWQIGEQATYALEGFVPNAGAVTTWLRQLGAVGPDSWPRIRAGALSGGPDGRTSAPWCVPALFGLGTPLWTPLAAAEFGGLTADSTGDDVAEAALVGVVHQIVDAVDAVRSALPGPLGVIRVDGGFGRNESVLQAIADLSGLTLERTAAAEVTALGAGALAGLGSGRWDQAALASLPLPADHVARPDLSLSDRRAARDRWQLVLADTVRRWRAATQDGRQTP